MVLEQITHGLTIPLRDEFLARQRWRGSVPFQVVEVTRSAFLGIEDLAALGLRLSVDSIPHGHLCPSLNPGDRGDARHQTHYSYCYPCLHSRPEDSGSFRHFWRI